MANVSTVLRAVIPALSLSLMIAPGAVADPIPLIDAHSQVGHKLVLEDVLPLLNKAGISRAILSTNGQLRFEYLVDLAEQHPDRITASVRTKSRAYSIDHPKYYSRLYRQLDSSGFGAMAEVILYHAKKGNKAAEWIIEPDAPQVTAALKAAKARRWPFIIHIEFSDADGAGKYEHHMASLAALADAHPGHPFALIHMGQLSAAEVGRLIRQHRNLHFLTSSTNPDKVERSKQPWTNMFDDTDERLAQRWRGLVVNHPDRFIMAFDNVWEWDWNLHYATQVNLWRKALADLPHGVAHTVAHRNAERLWWLKPAKYIAPE
jgi:predicted TIM-barrel fold metal-dependent hydrolase